MVEFLRFFLLAAYSIKSEIVSIDKGHSKFFPDCFSKLKRQFSAAVCLLHVDVLCDALTSHAFLL
jgi:hypothetical protein